jgi:hypothetical protein
MDPAIDDPMTRRWAWWRLAERFCGGLTTPQVDVAAADRHVEALIRDSWLWSCAQSFASKLQAAWLDSHSRVLVRWTASRWQ